MRKIFTTLALSIIGLTYATGQCDTARQVVTVDATSTSACWTLTPQNPITLNYTGISGGVLRMIPKHIGSLAIMPRVYNGSGSLSFQMKGLGAWKVGVMESPSNSGSFVEISSGTINTSISTPYNFDFSTYQGEYQYVAIWVTKGVYANADIIVHDLNYTSGCPLTDFPVFNVDDDVQLELDASGNAGIAVTDIDNGSHTACGLELSGLSLDVTSFTCADLGNNDITLTASYDGSPIGTKTISVEVVDNVAPTAIGQDITVGVNASTGYAVITPAQIDNGSTDNCDGSPTLTLSRTTFTCEDTGDNLVTLTVEDADGNSSQVDVTVTITSEITDQVITGLNTEMCPDGTSGSTISTDGSVIGFNYTMRNSENDTLVDGPYVGTGSGLSFNTGNVSQTATYSIVAEKVLATTQSALEFDGVNDYVNLGTNDRSVATEVTVAAWIKSTSTDYSYIVSKYNGINGYLLYFNTDGKAGMDGRDGSGVYRASGLSATSVNDGQWHYLTGTANVTTGTWSIYVDGILESSSTPGTGTSLATSSGANLNIGAQSTYLFDGKIDQVTIWNDELSASQVLTNLTSCLTGSETDVVGHFIFEDGSGNTLTDQSNTSVDGTLTNMDGSTDWIQETSPSCGDKACNYQLSTEVTVGDDSPPTAIAQNISAQVNLESGTVTIMPADIDYGSSDNCTSSPILSLDKSTFSCEDVGENTVTLIVEDESGNQSTVQATVTISSAIDDEVVTITDSEICAGGGSTTVTTGSSMVGVNYYLRTSLNDNVLHGPVAGTGSGLSFNTGTIYTSTTFNILAETDNSPDGYALDFDGTNDHVELPIPSGFDYSAGYTFEARVKVPQPVSGHSPIFSIGSSTISDVEIYIQSGTNVMYVVHDRGEASLGGYGYTVPPNNQWFQLAVTYDGNTGIKVYYNGVLQSPTVTNFAPSVAMTETAGLTMHLGKARHTALGTNGGYFGGQIDEVRLWNGARPAADIASQYNTCVDDGETNLAAYFRLNDGAGTTVTDQVNGNNGTMTNMDAGTDWQTGSGVTCGQVCSYEMPTEVTLTVGDNVDPVVVTKNVSLILDAGGSGYITTANIDNGSSDNCTTVGSLEFELDVTNFDCEDIGENTVTLTVRDAAGNEGTGTAIVTVTDQLAPTALAQNITLSLNSSGNVTLDPASLDNGSSDICTASDKLTFYSSITEFDCDDLGANAVTFTVEDESGNQKTANVYVTIKDEIGPVAVAQNTTLELDANGEATLVASSLNDGSTDNCTTAESLQFSVDVAEFDCSDLGANSVNLTVTDASGNETTTTATVTVIDNIAPVTDAAPLNLYLDASGGATLDPSLLNDESSDNCSATDDLIFSADITSFDCESLGQNDVVLTVEDASGNSNNSSTIVTILDTISPTVVVRGFTVELDTDGVGSIAVGDIDNGSTDNCTATGDLQMSLDKTDFTCDDLGTQSVTLTVTDASGNSESAKETVTIVDNINPTAQTQNITVNLDENGNASISASQVDDGSSDNCTSSSDLVMSLDVSSFSEDDLGDNTVTLTVEDASGNTAMSSALVTIVQKETQTITFGELESKTYGTEDFDLVATASSGLAVSFDLVSGSATLDGTKLSVNGAGEIEIRATQEGDDTYGPADEVRRNLVVDKATLEVVADDFTITYGEALPTYTYQISGYVQDETSDDLTTIPSITSSATTTSDAGTYDLEASGGESNNYTFSYSNGTLTINKADQIISVDPIDDKLVTDESFDLEASVNSSLDLIYTVTSGPATLDGNTVSLTGEPGTVVITLIQEGTTNYNEASTSISFVVTDPSLQNQAITFETIEDVVYGQQIFLEASASSGLAVGYKVLSGPATIQDSVVSTTGVGTVEIEVSQSGGSGFNPASSVQQSFTVTAATLTVTAVDKTITYGEQIPSLAISYSGFVGSDDTTSLASIPGAKTDATDQSDAGSYSITVSGGEADNYTFEYVAGELSITKATAQITFGELSHEMTGSPIAVDVTTNPVDLNVMITYDQLESAPSLPGVYEVKAIVVEANYQGESEATLTIIDNQTLSLDNNTGLSVYPNPASHSINVSIEMIPEGRSAIYDLNGIKVTEMDLSNGKAVHDVSTLKTGVYLMTISEKGGQSLSSKMVLIRR